jgi:hypothetical protein
MFLFIIPILLLNIFVSGFILIIHINKSLWNRWEQMTIKYPVSHYYIAVLNVIVCVSNIFLLYYLLKTAQG